MSRPSHLEIIPLGGLGEFGMNMMVYRYGRECVLVDAGMMFPGAEHLGVDVVIPNLEFLDDCGTLHAVVLTHAHEDHIGALPYLLARHDVPVYATRHAQALLHGRLVEHDLAREVELRALPEGRERASLGPFAIESIPVAHSIPRSRMVVLRTPVGLVLHTADFKLDPQPPDGEGTDLTRLAELGREGVLLLLSDSTNADRPGFTAGELSVTHALDRVIGLAEQRVLVTTFSSNIRRIESLARLARRHRRRLAVVGTSMQTHVEVAEDLGLLRFPRSVRVPVGEAMGLPRERVLIVATGSQGEPLSALARIAVSRHRDVELEPGDLVVHSARRIPGNEKSIARMINHLLRRGAEVITAEDAPVHVSGHPSQDELRLLLQLTRPKFLLPIHGEYRQLHAHARLGADSGLNRNAVLLAESGDRVVTDGATLAIADRVPVGHVYIDATLDEVDRAILRERRQIAVDGIVVPVVSLDRESGTVSGEPEIVTRGFVPGTDQDEEGVMREARQVVIEAIAEASPEERTDEAILKARIQADLRRFLKRRTQRRPLVIPVIVEY